MTTAAYDPWQFAARKSFPVEAHYTAGEIESTGISFDDYSRMQTHRHSSKPAAWVPPFAMNDSQLQKVLLIRAWCYVNGPRRLPIPDPASINREEINRAATAKVLRGYTIRPDAPAIQHQAHAMHLESVRRAGGYLQLLAAIAFRAWRLGMDSVAVAESLGTSPQAVRVHLWRFRDAAKDLGFEVGRAGHSAGAIRSTKVKQPKVRKPRKPTIEERIISLHKDGVPITEIARQVGWQQHKHSWLRCILRAAGFPIPLLHKKPLPLDAEQVIALGRSGLLPRKIEAALGRKRGTIQKRIRKILREAGVTRPKVLKIKPVKKQKRRPFDSPRAEALYRAGWRVVDIAVALGYQRGHGQNSVRRYLLMAGVYK